MTVQLVPGPFLFPQRCHFTGDGTPDREIIDTGVNDLEGGRIYVSLQFMDELAVVAGYASRAETEALRAENEELKRVNAILPDALERAANAVRAVAVSAVSDLLSGVPDGDVPVLVVSPKVAGGAGKPAQGGAALTVEQGRARL